MKKSWIFALLVFVTVTAMAVTPMTKPDPVHARLVPAVNAKPGAIVEVKLDLEINREWHMFSDKPEVPGVTATQLILDPSDAFTVDHIVYPKATPEHSEVFQKDLRFYKDQVTISAFLKIADKASGDIPVKGLLKFQACSDTLCLPPAKLPVSGTQKVTP
jgi:hypothetical protein